MSDLAVLNKLDTIAKNLQYAPEESIEKIDTILNDEGALSRKVHMKGLYYKGCALMFSENTPEMKAIANKLKNVAERLQDRENMMRSYNLLGIAHCNLNDHYQAITFYKKGYSLAQSLKDCRMVAVQALNISDVLFAMEKYKNAKDFAQISIIHSTKIHYHRLTATAHCRLANIHLLEKDCPSALLALQDAKKHIASDFQPLDFFYYDLTQAKISLYKGNLDQGKHLLDQAKAHLQIKKTQRTEILLAIAHSDHEGARGNLQEAEKLLLRALGLCRALNKIKLEIEICSKLSSLYAKMNQPNLENRFLKRWIRLKSERFHAFCDYDIMKDFMENDFNRNTCITLQKENAKLKEERVQCEQGFHNQRRFNEKFDQIMMKPNLSSTLLNFKDALKELHPTNSFSFYYYNHAESHWLDLYQNLRFDAAQKPELNEVLYKSGKLTEKDSGSAFYQYAHTEFTHCVALFCVNKEGDVLTVILQNFHLLNLPEAMETFIKRVMLYLFCLIEINRCNDHSPQYLKTLQSFNLTKTEKEIVQYVCQGLSNKEIASKCNVSVYTVRNQLSFVFTKMGVSNRYEVISKLLNISQDSFS
ncbi:helix-turn-helix domain-containing protein [Isachenkonia alkalipeptolytica]|uniref:Helix-turn-helix transcriptional regulator n=1 Tax=Isachenkonia alkalipeptolytica TaxID=2565777 RepID=A0AA43XNC6_9CLOT|nr:helix-turn-helix transcriptional regulator [Isachenkonia alkalipeptolytica]NBG89571.1 helix-turn-helix transcriptional regulator [Isachenkonia alkalipeptolytica]